MQEVPRLKFLTMCGAIRSLKAAYAGSFIFHLHKKFLFWNFAAGKRNIFSRPDAGKQIDLRHLVH
jgi:hypothetical protein